MSTVNFSKKDDIFNKNRIINRVDDSKHRYMIDKLGFIIAFPLGKGDRFSGG
jgi:hypothetical protein